VSSIARSKALVAPKSTDTESVQQGANYLLHLQVQSQVQQEANHLLRLQIQSQKRKGVQVLLTPIGRESSTARSKTLVAPTDTESRTQGGQSTVTLVTDVRRPEIWQNKSTQAPKKSPLQKQIGGCKITKFGKK
jgi:hypothetical protein